MLVARDRGKGVLCVMNTGFPFGMIKKFWKGMFVMTAHQCERT